MLVSLLFVNSQHIQSPNVKMLGALEGEVPASDTTMNLPQKMIMITMISCSVCGLLYISVRSFFPTSVVGTNGGCYYISNAMLSGVISVAASGESIEIWQAMSIAGVGCIIYTLGSLAL